MHQCLFDTEVQRAIFREVYHQHRGLGTLARLGRTCRAFNSTALDVLWTRLDSFVYLIQCLPPDLWHIVNTQVTFQRSMSPEDWEVFFRYSSRVQELSGPTGCQTSAHGGLRDDVIVALSTPPRYGPLIPSLRTLHWNGPDSRYGLLLHALMTPSLVSLSLCYTFHSPKVSIPISIATVCPSLKRLRLGTDNPDAIPHINQRCKNILSETLPYLHSLESFISPSLDETAIIHLSQLSSLVELSLKPRPFQLEKIKPLLAAPAFASLQSLTLGTSTLPILTSFLEPMRIRPRSVAFVVESVCTPDALHLFFLALISACGSEGLSQISLTTLAKRLHDQQVPVATFQSLFQLPNIDTFELDGPYDVLDDDGITALVKHWPKLTSISINKGWGITPRMTHKGLMMLLSCTALTHIALPVDFSGIDMEHPRLLGVHPGNGVTNDKCHLANFVTSKITYPLTIAAFLSGIFPKLKTVETAWYGTVLETNMDPEEISVYINNWHHVEQLLSEFSMTREQCIEGVQMEEGDRGGEPYTDDRCSVVR